MSVPTTRLTAALVAGVIGCVLIGYEAIRTLRSTPLGTLGTVLLYVGLGLVVIATALVLTGDATENLGVDTE